jgi:hypothetical protein
VSAREGIGVSVARAPTERMVTAEMHTACPFSVADTYAADYLRRAEGGSEASEIRVPIRFLPLVIRQRVAVTFGLHVDIVEAGRKHDEIRVRWTTGTGLLPDFHGTIRFRVDGLGTNVIVEGSYRAPFGGLGRVFDELIGRHIARAGIRDLTRRLARHLEAREREWRSAQRAGGD